MLQMQLALSSRSGIEEDGKGGAGDNIGMASKQPREGGMNLRQQAVRPHLPDSTASHHGQQLVPFIPPGVQCGQVGLLRHLGSEKRYARREGANIKTDRKSKRLNSRP